MEVKGVGINAATMLKLLIQAARRYQTDRAQAVTVLNTTEAIGQYVLPLFYGAVEEVVYLVLLNGQQGVIHHECLAVGSVNSTSFDVRRAAELAIRRRAVYAVLAHNHPGGIALPSASDLKTTERMISALAPLNIRLADHIIVVGEDFVSLRDSRRLMEMERRLGL